MITKYFTELRNRLLLIFVCSLCITIIIYLYKEILLFLFTEYSDKDKFSKDFFLFNYFIFTDTKEILQVYLILCEFINLQIIGLVTVYHIFIFLTPSLFWTEFFHLKFFLLAIFYGTLVSSFLIIFILIPSFKKFLLSFHLLIQDQSFNLFFEAKLKDYILFYVSTYSIISYYFQIFIIFLLVLKLLVFHKNKLQKFRKITYFFFMITVTFIAPPDIWNQFCLTGFCIFFYEIFSWILLFTLYLKNVKRLFLNICNYIIN